MLSYDPSQAVEAALAEIVLWLRLVRKYDFYAFQLRRRSQTGNTNGDLICWWRGISLIVADFFTDKSDLVVKVGNVC